MNQYFNPLSHTDTNEQAQQWPVMFFAIAKKHSRPFLCPHGIGYQQIQRERKYTVNHECQRIF